MKTLVASKIATYFPPTQTFHLLAMASNPIAIVSNLIAIASRLPALNCQIVGGSGVQRV